MKLCEITSEQIQYLEGTSYGKLSNETKKRLCLHHKRENIGENISVFS